MIDPDKFRAKVNALPGDAAAVAKALLLELADEIELGNSARTIAEAAGLELPQLTAIAA